MDSVEFRTNARDVEIVLARTLHTFDWTEPYRHRRTIYQKGPESLSAVCTLPDIGGYTHTYLHHIVTHYDDLALFTLFLNDNSLAASPDSVEAYLDVNEGMVCDSIHLLDLTEPDWLDSEGFFKKTGIPRSQSHTAQMQCASIPYATWYARAIAPYLSRVPTFADIRTHFMASATGNFCLHRSVIHDKPIEFYRSLLNWVSAHRNPEWGNYIDHSWLYIFDQRTSVPHESVWSINPDSRFIYTLNA